MRDQKLYFAIYCSLLAAYTVPENPSILSISSFFYLEYSYRWSCFIFYLNIARFNKIIKIICFLGITGQKILTIEYYKPLIHEQTIHRRKGRRTKLGYSVPYTGAVKNYDTCMRKTTWCVQMRNILHGRSQGAMHYDIKTRLKRIRTQPRISGTTGDAKTKLTVTPETFHWEALERKSIDALYRRCEFALGYGMRKRQCVDCEDSILCLKSLIYCHVYGCSCTGNRYYIMRKFLFYTKCNWTKIRMYFQLNSWVVDLFWIVF